MDRGFPVDSELVDVEMRLGGIPPDQDTPGLTKRPKYICTCLVISK